MLQYKDRERKIEIGEHSTIPKLSVLVCESEKEIRNFLSAFTKMLDYQVKINTKKTKTMVMTKTLNKSSNLST